MRDRLGWAFFSCAAVVSFLAAWEHPSMLAWLAGLHNAVLAVIYAHRKPALKYDRLGLCLGLLAPILPMTTVYSVEISLPLMITGILGYCLVFWSLISLGNRFGIAPADRGLVVCGPYRIVRHPMYLGDLVRRAALVTASMRPLLAGVLRAVLLLIQHLRAFRA